MEDLRDCVLASRQALLCPPKTWQSLQQKHVGVYENKGPRICNPQIVGFPDNKDPNKVPPPRPPRPQLQKSP